MRLRPEEPAVTSWLVAPLRELVLGLLNGMPAMERPHFVAIDGRTSSGKTTLSGRVAEAFANAAVVHTDDIAWHHSRFGWADLIATGVLEPARRGLSVSFRPPAWEERRRPGAVEVPPGTALLVVEGVGSSRAELAHFYDARLWVQADEDETAQRTAGRVRSGETTAEGVAGWMAEEYPYLARERPWLEADVIVVGTPEVPHDPETEVVVGDLPED